MSNSLVCFKKRQLSPSLDDCFEVHFKKQLKRKMTVITDAMWQNSLMKEEILPFPGLEELRLDHPNNCF